MKERTLVLIKPDAISKRLTGIIIDRIEHLGLDMKAAKVRIMTEELARKHYPHLEGKPFLQDVINFMRGDYNGIKDHRIYAFVYEGEDANVYTDHSDDYLVNDITARLQMFPNLVLTSHQAFFTREALQAIAAVTLENARNFNEGNPLGFAECKA